MPPFLPFQIFLAPFLAVYGLVMLVRRKRLLSAAAALQATFVSESWWRPGRIAGPDFTIRFTRARKTFLTNVEVSTLKPPCANLLLARFFDPYPNWEYARVLGPNSERLFFTSLSFPLYAPPTPEERDVLWSWLNRGSTDRRLSYEALTSARIR